MGVIKPPWVDEEWFLKCPYNYCDHFGDKIELARICKICREELMDNVEMVMAGKNPSDAQYTMENLENNFQKTYGMIEEQVFDFSVNTDSLYPLSKLDLHSKSIFKLVKTYGKHVD